MLIWHIYNKIKNGMHQIFIKLDKTKQKMSKTKIIPRRYWKHLSMSCGSIYDIIYLLQRIYTPQDSKKILSFTMFSTITSKAVIVLFSMLQTDRHTDTHRRTILTQKMNNCTCPLSLKMVALGNKRYQLSLMHMQPF